MREQVEEAIQEIRPYLQADGGNIELIDVTDGVVKVKLLGACAGCPMSKMTLQMGVERTLKKKIPEIVRVEAV
ncbi:NifU family protein [Candidatus Bathyarchaeota archaeon]|nr:MAG: NifU family protein [Candidatus Bathyarchaeota archaeon]